MAGWNTKKRFWTEVSVRETEAGFAITLDERALKTPAKTDLVVPSLALAQAIAAEWQSQGDEIDPAAMPVTRSANSAIDKVAAQHSDVADMLADYGATDLTCYRAESPAELRQRQDQAWDPLLDWAAQRFDARLVPVSGIMFQEQDAAALQNLRAQVHVLDNFQLAGFHDLVCISGSLIIGLAAMHEFNQIEELWLHSRVDESWQEEQWGEDDEAVVLASTKKTAFLEAFRFLKLL